MADSRRSDEKQYTHNTKVLYKLTLYSIPSWELTFWNDKTRKVEFIKEVVKSKVFNFGVVAHLKLILSRIRSKKDYYLCICVSFLGE